MLIVIDRRNSNALIGFLITVDVARCKIFKNNQLETSADYYYPIEHN